MLRVYLLHHRELLGKLTQAPPETAKELLAAAAMEEKGFRPGLVVVVQTFGDRADFHPPDLVLPCDARSPLRVAELQKLNRAGLMLIAARVADRPHEGTPLASLLGFRLDFAPPARGPRRQAARAQQHRAQAAGL